MFFKPADDFSLTLFIILVASNLIALLALLKTALIRLGRPWIKSVATFAAILFVWLSLVAFLVHSGWMGTQPFPRIPILGITTMTLTVLFVLSPWGSAIAKNISPGLLVAYQSFRLPLEWILSLWGEQGTIPMTMTWSGQNFDFLTGLLAIVVALFFRRNIAVLKLFNYFGMVMLLNVGRVAAMSSPFPFAWKVDPPLQLALHLPYVYIVPVCIASALAMHLILWRALKK